MLETEIVKHCAPTLAGIKTGNLFATKQKKSEIMGEMRKLNGMLAKKGLRLIPMQTAKGNRIVYLYRPSRLRKDLNQPEAQEILHGKGYSLQSAEQCLAEFARRLQEEQDFPHEMGLFLGYPPADVKGFMNSPCEGVKCVGCWKVYSNEHEARKTFAQYKKCTDIYRREKKKGKPLEALIVETEHSQESQVALEA